MKNINNQKMMRTFFVIIALTAFGLALSNNVFSNYFKEVYDVSAYQRGLIEFPRELPGLLCVVVVSLLGFLGDLRLAIIAQLLSVIGLIFLGLFTPPFAIMLIFLFINSMGMHLYMPLQDAIGMNLIKNEKIGKKMGEFKGVSTLFAMLGSAMVVLGFRTGFFSFQSNVKLIFLISASMFVVALLLFIRMIRLSKEKILTDNRIQIRFKKKYKFYYILAIMHGAQKQIMAVFGPWVLIELLYKKADTLAILSMIGAFIGIFFMPMIGRGIDRLGIKKMLYFDAISFIFVYVAYGLFTHHITSNININQIIVIGVFVLFILDKMSMQMGMIKIVYLREIAIDKKDVVQNISLGISMDHVVSILCAYAGGIVWSVWGAEYIFYLAAVLSIVNLLVAIKVKV